MKDQTKYLVAGTSNANNQINRKLLKDYQIEAMHTDQETSHFPKDADVVICVSSSLSKSKYNAIRSWYNGRAKIFITSSGFSEISHQFDSFLYEKSKQAEQTTVAWKYYQQTPIFNTIKTPSIQQEQEQEPIPKAIPLIYEREKVYQLIKDCAVNNFTINETVEMVNAEGLMTKSGKAFDYDSVNSIRQTLRNKGEIPALVSEVVTQVTEKTMTSNTSLESSEVQPTQSQASIVDLLGLILASPEDDVIKLSLIKQVHAGEITSDIMVYHSECNTDDGPVVVIHEHHLRTSKRYESELSKNQATYILKNLSALEDFVKI